MADAAGQQIDPRDPADLRELGRILGGEVVDLACREGGKSRTFWTFDLHRSGKVVLMVILRETGEGPWYGTPFEMRREAQTMRALAAAGVAVPDVHYISANGDCMVMDRLGGTASFAFADQATRLSVIGSFTDALARLHELDVASLDLGRRAATSARQGILDDLADYEQAYKPVPGRRKALIDAGMDWLRANMPDLADRPSFVHGDAGPTNFMHDGGRLTGLIDWEMAHIGDPREDLAWIWFRSTILKHDVDPADWFAAYRRRTGLEMDEQAMTYFIALVLLRCSVATQMIQERADIYDDTRPSYITGLLEAAMSDAKGILPRKLPPVPV